MFCPKKQNSLLSKALTYKVIHNNKTAELWFYINEKNGQILYVPEHKSIKAIISKPNGIYEVYAIDENGKKIKKTEEIKSVVASKQNKLLLKTLKNHNIVVNQKNIQQPNIFCKAYLLDYLKSSSSEQLHATTQIPINSYQLYGFSKLDNDAKLPFSLDYIGVFSKKQLVTHIDSEFLSISLLNYGPNPYQFDRSGF